MIAEPIETTGRATRWVQRYASVSDWTTAEPPASRGASNPSWSFGTLATAPATVEAIRCGSAHPALWESFEAERDRLEPALGELTARMPSARKRRRFRDEGAELNVDRLMSGAPDHWERRERGARRLCVKLGLNVEISCGNAESAFVRLAARTAAAADLLERLGYAVELHAIAGVRSPHGLEGVHEYALHAPVKRADEPLDVGRVLCLGLPGLVRWCVFGMQERDGTKSPYGLCYPLSQETRALIGVDAILGRDWKVETGDQSDRIEAVRLREILAAVQSMPIEENLRCGEKTSSR